MQKEDEKINFAEFFFSEENKRPSRQRQIHLPSITKPAIPVRDRGVEPPQITRWLPKKQVTDGGIAVVPNLIPKPQTVFGKKRPTDR